MRIIYIILIILQAGTILASGLSESLLHESPAPTMRGDAIHLEITNAGLDRQIYNPTLFYRQRGELEYKSVSVLDNGFILSADIPTEKLQDGVVEYYFAFQSANGQAFTLPEISPESYPMRTEIVSSGVPEAQNTETLEILLLSPEPNEMVEADDFFLALALPVETESRTDISHQLIIGGVDVTGDMERDGVLFSLSSSSFRSGLHNAEFKIFDDGGNLIGKRNWSFRVKQRPSDKQGFNSRTSIFINNRYQSIGRQGIGNTVNRNENNFFRGGIRFDGNYNMLDVAARLIVDSEESSTRQPLNQYALNLMYNFSPTSNIYVKIGDVYTDYDPLSYWGKRVRGFGAGFNFKYFNLDFTSGQSARGIEGSGTISTQPDEKKYQVDRYGYYSQNFMAIRPEFKFGSHVTWGLNLINGKDDPNSIDPNFANNPKESLVIGTTLNMNFDNSNIMFTSSFQASMKNEDARGTVDFDTLAKKHDLEGDDLDNARRIYDFMESTGFLTVSQGLSPSPSLAMRLQMRLRYLRQDFTIGYRKIEANYVTAGNPYLQKDISGLHIRDNIRLMGNQIFMNLFFRSFDDNISRGDAKTNSTDFGASLSYYPFGNLPSVTLSYNNLSRKNELARKGVSPDSSFLLIEDNKTQQIGISSSYNFQVGAVRNTISAGVSSHKRDDMVYPNNKSEFTMFNIGLRNQFDFPLTARISYAQTGSGFGQDTSKSTTDIQKFFIDVQYSFKNSILNSDIRPFIQFNLQNIKNDYAGGYISNRDYSRKNFAGGLYIRNREFGTLTFRYDHINFGAPYDWSDSIISTRYDVSF